MKYKRFLLSMGILLSISISNQAQSSIEALRYGSTFQIGTARNISLGGTMGSVGADFSNLSTNPAGIARFKSTEFQISLATVFGNTEATYFGKTLSDEHINANISSAGIAFARRLSDSNKWKSFSLGFGVNRLNQYNEDIFISGENNSGSLLDLYASEANGLDGSLLIDAFPFDIGLAYESGLIFSDVNNNYTSVLENIISDQDITISRSGGKYEAALGAGGNFDDKVYVGASIGIPIIQFTETQIINEENSNRGVDSGALQFNSYDIRNELRTFGYGINLKFGVLGKLHKYVRVGASFHSPSLIRLNDQYASVLTAELETDTTFIQTEAVSPSGEFDYRLVTPWKFGANAAFLIGKYGFVSTVYELSNPGRSKFRFKSNDADVKEDETDRNQQIENSFVWQHAAKLGVEFKVDPVRVRFGFQYKTSALGSSEPAELTYSGGLGYRGKHFFIDGAYSFISRPSNYVPYENDFVTSGTANLDNKRSQVTITVGYKL